MIHTRTALHRSFHRCLYSPHVRRPILFSFQHCFVLGSTAPSFDIVFASLFNAAPHSHLPAPGLHREPCTLARLCASGPDPALLVTYFLVTVACRLCRKSCRCACANDWAGISIKAAAECQLPTMPPQAASASPALSPDPNHSALLPAPPLPVPPPPAAAASDSWRMVSGKRAARVRHSGVRVRATHCSAMRSPAREEAASPARCARSSASSSCRIGCKQMQATVGIVRGGGGGCLLCRLLRRDHPAGGGGRHD